MSMEGPARDHEVLLSEPSTSVAVSAASPVREAIILLAPVSILLQAAVALWIWSVWTWRYALKTAFRPANTRNRVAEFKTYGLPSWMLGVVGVLELGSGTCLAIGIMLPKCFFLLGGSLGLIALMVGAVVAHAKVGDPPFKFLACTLILFVALFVASSSFAYVSDDEGTHRYFSCWSEVFTPAGIAKLLFECDCAPDGSSILVDKCWRELVQGADAGSDIELGSRVLLPFSCLLPSQVGRVGFGLCVLAASAYMLAKAYNAGVYRRRFSSSQIFDANVLLLDDHE